MFYGALEELTPDQHLGYGVRPQHTLATARQANAVPLGVGEFGNACHHYPIVFGPAGATGFPVVLTALQEGRNLFIDAQDAWLAATYMPAYLRRYPFWMQVDGTGQNAQILFDPQAGKVVPLHTYADAQPLFDYAGQPNRALLQIVELCQQSLQDEANTRFFMAALEEEKLLVDRQARLELAPGQYYELGGFRVIDMEAYRKLPDATLAHWVRMGWADLVTLHGLSVAHNWEHLSVLHRQLNT